ncbi:MAG: LysM peptidoglycan-binding domain-containing protein, partial [Chloroflexi bacterium]|nr:LysM peptidoglycan-binding domain-containing protein [Chloroflexota bacterium]
MRYLVFASLLAIMVVTAGCSGSAQPTYTPPPTYTPYPTYTPAIVTGAIWLCRHVVQPGDTVEALAAYYNTTARAIMQENNLRTV